MSICHFAINWRRSVHGIWHGSAVGPGIRWTSAHPKTNRDRRIIILTLLAAAADVSFFTSIYREALAYRCGDHPFQSL